MQITIVIPNYNGEKYIRRCLNSLLIEKEDFPDFEILIIDNASTDTSLQIIQEEFSHIKVIKLAENTGFCHAVNLGIKESHTPYVILLNNDTEVQKGFVKSLYSAIDTSTKIFSVSPLMISMQDQAMIDDAGDQLNALGWAYARGKDKSISQFSKKKKVFAACGGASIYRKKVFEKIGYFDENHFAYLEDIDIGYRARIYGYQNLYEPNAKVLHMGSAVSGSRYNEFKTKLVSRNNIYMILKNMPLLQLILNAPFLLLGFIIKILFFYRKKMGMLYCKGLIDGFRLYKKQKEYKQTFKMEHFVNYFVIQILLLLNIFRYFIKS